VRILVDLLGFTGLRGGTETYARELLPRLPRLLPGIEFAALTGRAGTEHVREFFPGRVHTLGWVGAGPASWAAGAIVATDTFARRNGADLVWAPANFGPIVHGVPRVVTVHDAIYDEVPGSRRERAQRAATSWLMTRSARTADLVLTVSHAAAASIHNLLGVPDDRIRIAHNGSEAPRPVADPWAAIADLRIPRDRSVLLSTGSRLPHKNLEGLLDALSRIHPKDRPVSVIAGSKLPDPLAPEVTRRGLDDDVILPGWVTRDQLEALYQVAAVYVCPSRAEGFGLPVLDALRRGVPVIASDIPVLREVGGGVASYVPVGEPRSLADAIQRTLGTPWDTDNREAALTWAARFTWESAAQATAQALADALDRSRRGSRR
tara:strand:+ start:4915 stop:6045 length:1131 start_codon:yes stop_codon:yes gene_type:complete